MGCRLYFAVKLNKKETRMNLQEWLNNFTAKHNLIYGFTNSEPLDLPEKNHCNTPYVSNDIRKRTDPAAELPSVKTIIVVGMPYALDFPNKEVSRNDEGKLSVLARGPDYHKSLKSVLKTLIEELSSQISFQYKILVDSGTLDERALAVRAGLGFFGRHGMVISRKFGSRFYIGCLLTDIPYTFSIKPRPKSGCPPICSRCVGACPTKALSLHNVNEAISDEYTPHACGYGLFDVSKCISHLTQSKALDAEDMALMGVHLYGCDLCQAACPFNKTTLPNLCDNTPAPTISPEDWLEEGAVLYEKYGRTTMLWKGGDILRRNALVVMANLDADKAKKAGRLALAERYIHHPDEMVSNAAVYACKKLGRVR